MDFNWTEAQLARQAAVQQFAATRLTHEVDVDDHLSRFPQEKWRACAEFGIQAMSLPTAYSGFPDTDFLTAILAMEGFGYGCRDNGLAFALNAQMWTVQLPIVQAGSEALKARFLPPLAAGDMIGCHAITEDDTGSDVFSLATRATACDGGYVLNGKKRYVSLGPVADVALVFASTDPSVGKWGISAFLVETASAGCRVGVNREKMGLRSVPFGELIFEDCLVPVAQRLGAEGAGVSLSNGFLEWERCSILASQLGAMARQLDETIAYARKRHQFGQAIGKFQSVSNRIVDMKLRLETARLLLYKVAWLKMSGRSAIAEAALLKLHISESFTQSSLDAIRVHGGEGYVSEAGIERDLRDAVGGLIYAGTSDIQRNIVARMLGL